MKASTVIAAAVALTGSIVSAQLSDIPQCALTCAIQSLGSTGCGSTDIKCICLASGFVAALQPCVEKACSASDLQKTITAAEGLCAQAGVSLSIPAVSPTGSAPAMTSSAVMATTTSVVATTSAVVVTSSTTMMSSVVIVPSNTTMTSMMSSAAPTSNATVTTSVPSSPSPSGNAAGRNTVAIGSLGAILAFVAALL